MWYRPEEGILHHQFYRHVWGDTFREALNKGAEVLERYGGTKWLSDDRENCALPQADTEWAIHDWFPRVRKLGWEFWAIVLPEHVIGQMNMRRFVETYTRQGVVAQVFDSPTTAITWLQDPDRAAILAPKASGKG
jgi:hypothetical protein